MTNDEAKAVEAVADTTGKAIDASRELGGFVSRFIGGPLEQAAGIVEDKLKYLRWERQIRLMQRANAFLAENGMSEPTRQIPMKIAIPLLQGASLEENDELQDRWAKLLVNAADRDSGVDVPRMFVSIMDHMDPLSAAVLDKIYSVPDEDAKEGIWTKNLPGSVILKPAENEDMSLSTELEIALSNLALHRLVSSALFWGGTTGVTCVYKTDLGKAFLAACTIRAEK